MREEPLDWVVRSGMNNVAFNAELVRRPAEGLHLVDVGGCEADGEGRFVGVWEKLPGAVRWMQYGATAAILLASHQARLAEGYRPVHVCAYTQRGKPRFAAIWERGPGPAFEMSLALDPAKMDTTLARARERGLRPVRLCGYGEGAATRHAALFVADEGVAWEAAVELPADELEARAGECEARGLALTRLSGRAEGDSARFAAVWEGAADGAGTLRRMAWRDRDEIEHGELIEAAVREGARPLAVTAYRSGRRVAYAAVCASAAAR